jgi:excinuclease ABC subunit B
LTQVAGRAARNINGLVIMYADTITGSMQRTIDETNRRREKQIAYNEKHGITPETVHKSREEIVSQSKPLLEVRGKEVDGKAYVEPEEASMVADPVTQYMSKDDLRKSIDDTKKKMEKAAKDLDFMEAARLRDEMYAMEKLLKEK